jgi:ribosomal protein L7Ae-like RNA K-turn-binding protein
MLLNDKILNTLGLARSANKIIAGSDTVEQLLKLKKLKYVFVASDASSRTIDRFEKKCFFHETPVNISYSCEQLSKAVGKSMCKVLGVTDSGFANSLKKHLNGGVENEN